MALVSHWGQWRPFDTLLCLPSAAPLPAMDDHTSSITNKQACLQTNTVTKLPAILCQLSQWQGVKDRTLESVNITGTSMTNVAGKANKNKISTETQQMCQEKESCYHVKTQLFSKYQSYPFDGICIIYKFLNDARPCQDLLYFLGASKMVSNVWTENSSRSLNHQSRLPVSFGREIRRLVAGTLVDNCHLHVVTAHLSLKCNKPYSNINILIILKFTVLFLHPVVYVPVFIMWQPSNAVVQYRYSNSVRPSVCHVPVLYWNDLTHHHTFFSIR